MGTKTTFVKAVIFSLVFSGCIGFISLIGYYGTIKMIQLVIGD